MTEIAKWPLEIVFNDSAPYETSEEEAIKSLRHGNAKPKKFTQELTTTQFRTISKLSWAAARRRSWCEPTPICRGDPHELIHKFMEE